ncbi:MAG TPA: hypothetical protein VEM95_05940 [Thermoplasmata archaeon]|nr:hypothetical protein [Thermoplasmata archaeon]
MAGDADDLVKALRAKARSLADRFDERSVWSLRSELLAIDAYARANPKALDADARRALERALHLAGEAHALAAELKGFSGQKERSEAASLLDLGSIGALSIENILTADKITLPRIVMSSLSETLTFLATGQIVAGSREVLGGLYRQHAAAMYRELWTLATDHRKILTAKDVREVQAGIDGFFARLDGEGVPVEGQIVVLRQFYALLLVLRVAELLDALGG